MALVTSTKRPWYLNPDDLEGWYKKNLQEGTGSFNSYCREAINEVVTSLHSLCSSNLVPFNVDRVVKSGSLGKGTAVKDVSDVDLVAFVNPPHLQPILEVGAQIFKRQLASVLRDMEKAMCSVRNVREVRNNGFLICFTLTNIGPDRRSVSIDLMPTADCHLGTRQAFSDMFKAMLVQEKTDRVFYSAAVVESQLRFIRDQPVYVKDLIRLVKNWMHDFLPKKLQKSYRLELITVHRWENAGKPKHFSMAQGLKDILQILSDMSQLRVFWELYYDTAMAEQAISHFGMKRPIILDPVEPSDNVCSLYTEGNNMDVIQEAAMRALQSQLLRWVVVRSGWK